MVGQILRLRLDPQTSDILNKLAAKSLRSKAMTIRLLIRAAEPAVKDEKPQPAPTKSEVQP